MAQTITLYSTITCVYCKAVEKYLQMKNVAYEKIMLDDKPDLRQELINKTGAMTVPIITNGKDYVVGYNLTALQKLI